jgi:hypothetical protein
MNLAKIILSLALALAIPTHATKLGKLMKLGIYKHYKGNLYQVIGVARHTETAEEVVVYQSLYGDYGLWARPRAMFEETVEIEGKVTPRFTFLQESFTAAPAIRG